MNSDGIIAYGDGTNLKKLGFTIPLTKAEADHLSTYEQQKRLGMLASMRHEELKVRREKYPGQSTAYLVGANRP